MFIDGTGTKFTSIIKRPATDACLYMGGNRALAAPHCIVSPDESRVYLGFSTVTPPLQRFSFGRDNLKNILVRTFKFGMWVYMGNATSAIVL